MNLERLRFASWLKQLDEEFRKHDKSSIEHSKTQALRTSEAGKRALEIMKKLEEDNITFTDQGGCSYKHSGNPEPKVSKAREDAAIETAKKDVAEIADRLEKEGRTLDADLLGVHLLYKHLPEWVEMGDVGGYTSLRKKELIELLRLRGMDTDGQKPQLIRSISLLFFYQSVNLDTQSGN